MLPSLETPLFWAKTKLEEEDTRKRLNSILVELDNLSQANNRAEIHFNGAFGLIFAELIDIGSSPHVTALGSLMRDQIEQIGGCAIDLDPEWAVHLKTLLKAGIMRHEYGAMSRQEIIVH
jgi:hypothetical protein